MLAMRTDFFDVGGFLGFFCGFVLLLLLLFYF